MNTHILDFHASGHGSRGGFDPHPLWPILILLTVALAALAQSPPPSETPWSSDKGMSVMMGQSAVVHAPWPVKRVAMTDIRVADVKGLSAQRLLVISKAIGTTDLTIWNEKEEMLRMQVEVTADVEWLRRELARLLPQSALEVRQSHDVIVVSGTLRASEQAGQLKKFMEAASLKYVDVTRVVGVQQVQLQVRVAEVSRTAVRLLGMNGYYTGRASPIGQTVGPENSGPLNPISFGVPSGASATAAPQLQFLQATNVSPGVTLFGGFPNINLQIFLQALAENQYLRVLAEPTLVALSGEDASFLAGGEFPVPIPQSNGGTGTTITVEYKEFGVRLKFHPTVLGEDRIRLAVAPEVSELSTTGEVVLQGFSIPSILTRKAQTTLELRNGQTFAMAGLISRNVNAINSRIPGLGDLPVLGAFFRSVRYENDETELVVLVTATLVEPLSTGQCPPLPGDSHVAPERLAALRPGRDRRRPGATQALQGPGRVAQGQRPVQASRTRRLVQGCSAVGPAGVAGGQDAAAKTGQKPRRGGQGCPRCGTSAAIGPGRAGKRQAHRNQTAGDPAGRDPVRIEMSSQRKIVLLGSDAPTAAAVAAAIGARPRARSILARISPSCPTALPRIQAPWWWSTSASIRAADLPPSRR